LGGKMNVLDKLCPYCSDTMQVWEQETDWYGTLVYGLCESCNTTFVQGGLDGEWAEAAEQEE